MTIVNQNNAATGKEKEIIEYEKEILAHLMTIETFLCAQNKIKTEKWNKILEINRKQIEE